MASLLDALNAPQREAVTHGEGPLLVLAGAGSGKTRVLTYRIAHLLAEKQAEPDEITAVTFTNKAAGEMKERVRLLAGLGAVNNARRSFVGTFHRWALEILRRYPADAGLPSRFSIIDSDEQKAVMNRCLKLESIDSKEYAPRMVLSVISEHVNRGQSRTQYEQAASSTANHVIARLWRRYSQIKTEGGAVDFDDMLSLTLKMLRAKDGIRRTVQRRARYLLVDEFQDTNTLQMNLLKLIVNDNSNITAVGDEDQSIYGWRGAEIENILSFEKYFPGAKVVKLEQNYRSTKAILAVSGALIDKNQHRRGKRLFSEGHQGDAVRLFIAEDDRREASWVVDQLEAVQGSYRLGDMAVLFRTNAQTRPFEEELTRRRISYRVIGGLRFWQRAEVKDALAYLRLVISDDDVLAFERIINVPARGIGKVTVDALRAHSEASGQNLPAAARTLPETLTNRARIALERFFKLLDDAREQREQLRAGDFIGWLLEASGLLLMYDGDIDEKIAKRENLQQFAAAIAEADAQGQSLEELLDSVALMSDTDTKTSADAISLMTLHSAKGLEFDVVMLAGLEDGLLPHASSRDSETGLEEERRLAYVGITRAKKVLALTAARSRFLFGDRNFTTPSRFLDEIPPDLIEDLSETRPQALSFTSAPATPQRVSVPPQRPAPSRPKTAVATVVDETGKGWRPGDRVRHKRFGTGVVLSCQGRGPQLKLVVYFDRQGRKTLVPSIAKLEKM